MSHTILGVAIFGGAALLAAIVWAARNIRWYAFRPWPRSGAQGGFEGNKPNRAEGFVQPKDSRKS